MKCGKCGGGTLVVDSRRRGPAMVYRRRECKKCGYRFSTFETKGAGPKIRPTEYCMSGENCLDCMYENCIYDEED